tara:strand:- start:245 stop:736 length:492 start_codon:yes stop_codon:yes gene_type:complete
MNEDEIYLKTKFWFKKKSFQIIAGQPPNGTDSVPVIEIKDVNNLSKGSKGSYKPDLVAVSDLYLVIIECKPDYNSDDEKKLLIIKNDIERKKMLYEELRQRNLFYMNGKKLKFADFSFFQKNLRFCMSNSSKRRMNNISNLYIDDDFDKSSLMKPYNEEDNIN